MPELGRVQELLASPYAALGLVPPQVIWCSDPLKFARTVGEVRFGEAVECCDLRRPLTNGCGCPACLGIDVTDEVEGMLGADTDRVLARVLVEALREMDRSVVGSLEVRSHPVGCVRPARRPAWGVRSDQSQGAGLDVVADAWVFTPSTAVLLRRGDWRFDDRGRLHDSPEGPALVWGDWKAAFDHGVMLPSWALDPWAINPERILGERNVEVRSSLIVRYGVDRFVADNPEARLLDDDPDRGQLWDIGVEVNGQRVCMVRVVDATPTLGGDRKVYWLYVPPAVSTAHEAIAWTFDVEPSDYRPEVET